MLIPKTPYVNDTAAARLLGVAVEVVRADIDAYPLNLFALQGAKKAHGYFVHSEQLQGEPLKRHQKRLAAVSTGSQP